MSNIHNGRFKPPNIMKIRKMRLNLCRIRLPHDRSAGHEVGSSTSTMVPKEHEGVRIVVLVVRW